MDRRRVVITGMGAVTPLGCSVESFWDGAVNGRSGVRRIARFDPSDQAVQIGAECLDYDPSGSLQHKEIRRLDRFVQFAVTAGIEAARDCGIDFDHYERPDRIGVILGSGIGGLAEIEEQHKRLLDRGPGKVSAFTIPKLMVNAASGQLSLMFHAHGPSTAVATACASAANAMGDAFRTIQYGIADVMFTGGSEAAITPLGLAAFAAMRALSTRNDEPHRASRPFDRQRDGFVMGEGAGVLVFEELEHARRRGARIYAEVAGFGTTADAFHMTQPEETGRGAAEAMALALRDAGIAPDQIDYINAHGTSTPLGDVAETRAIKRVFGDHAYRLRVSSTKSVIGHLLGASGGVELIAAVKALVHQVAPPTINLDEPDAECDLNYVPNVAQDARIRCVMSNSFGFGGHNACLVLRALD